MVPTQPLRIVLSGQLLTYLLSNAYSIAGGLLGSPPGGEMRAAALAAQEVSVIGKPLCAAIQMMQCVRS
jgi:pheromone shutdown protein TraB